MTNVVCCHDHILSGQAHRQGLCSENHVRIQRFRISCGKASLPDLSPKNRGLVHCDRRQRQILQGGFEGVESCDATSLLGSYQLPANLVVCNLWNDDSSAARQNAAEPLLACIDLRDSSTVGHHTQRSRVEEYDPAHG